jgi:hypothetical protein
LSNSLFLFPLDLTSVDRRSEIWSLQSSQSSYLSTISSTSNSSLRLSLYHRILEPLVSKGQVHLLCQMEVESIILQEVRSTGVSRPYLAVGVIARNILTQGRHFFAPESDGEIVLSSGSLSSPQLLLNSIILPEGYSLSSLHDSFNTSEVAQYLDRLRLRAPSPSPSASIPTPQFRNFTLPGIGQSLLDHTILPFICIGNWWNSSSSLAPSQL